MLRDEWRERKPQSKPGVSLVVVNTSEKKKPEVSGQRMYVQRGPYVIEVNEWKSIYTDAAGKPVGGALSLAAVDEAVFSEGGSATGMERTPIPEQARGCLLSSGDARKRRPVRKRPWRGVKCSQRARCKGL